MNKQGLFWTLTLFLIITCTGCQSPESFSVSMWYDTLGQALNLFTESATFEEKQAQLNTWQVINELYDDQASLTYEVVQDTFKRYLHETFELNGDINDVVSKTEAYDYIELIKNKANNKTFNSEYDVAYQKPIYYIEGYEEDNEYFKCEEDLQIGDYLAYHKNNDLKIMEISEETLFGYTLVEVLEENLYQHFKISDSHDLDLSKATFEPSGNNGKYTAQPYINTAVTSNSFEYLGYHISYSISGSGVRGYVSKQFNQHNYFSEFELSNLKASYKWDYRDFTIKEAYFKLSYDSLFKVGVERTKFYDKNYTKNILSKNLSNDLKKLFNTTDEIEVVIPLGNIKIPLPQTLIMDISLALELHVYASGKVVLLIDSNHELGLEIINNNVRFINDYDKDIDSIFRASANVTFGLRGSLNAFGKSLLDIGAKAGIKGLMQQTLHLYDDYTVSSEIMEIDADALDTIVDNRFSICSDLSMHWVLAIYANSSRSLAGKLGLGVDKEFLSEINQIFNNQYTHLEHWKYVPKCTKKDQLVSVPTSQPKKEQIELSSYQLTMKVNDENTVPIKSYPADIKQSELVLQCQNEKICKVDGQKILALAEGQTTLIIQDANQKYEVRCHIIVSP